MSIITRFKDIMASSSNSLLDNDEDSEKMIEQYLRKLKSDFGKVKSETASILAEEQRTKRVVNECQDDIAKMERYAIKAVEAGSEGDARTFLEKKEALSAKLSELQASCQLASSNALRIKQMHDKLVAEIGELESIKSSDF